MLFKKGHKVNLVHGHNAKGKESRTHRSWRQMRHRCMCRNHTRWADYGGRGIAVCAAWDSFERFLADMGERPAGMSLDRKNVNGNYEPTNCRWATGSQQQRNRRDNT